MRTDGYPDPPKGHEWVNGSLMTIEEMEFCEWRIIDRYRVKHPHSVKCRLEDDREVTVWGFSRSKAMEWARLEAAKRKAAKEEGMKRRGSYQRSLEEDEHFRELYPELSVLPGGAA